MSRNLSINIFGEGIGSCNKCPMFNNNENFCNYGKFKVFNGDEKYISDACQFLRKLSIEDINDCGFFENDSQQYYEKRHGNWIYYIDNVGRSNYQIIETDGVANRATVYYGKISNKHELKMILNLLGII